MIHTLLVFCITISQVLSAAIMSHTEDLNGQCHCISNITINIPQCVCNSDSSEAILKENQQLLAELQLLKETTANSSNNHYGQALHIAIEGIRWTKFWWFTPQDWPTEEADVLGYSYGTCAINASYCFARLPDSLDENDSEMLAVDSYGSTYRWKFDSSNPTSHAVWSAFYSHEEQRVINSQDWDPIVIRGPTPNRVQDSFMYRMQNGVKSVMLDDDNCDGYTTLSMGHGMCGDNFLSTCGPSGRFGVDTLYDSYCQTPDPKHGLTLYFRDDDNCLSQPCFDDQLCLDKPKGHTCV